MVNAIANNNNGTSATLNNIMRCQVQHRAVCVYLVRSASDSDIIQLTGIPKEEVVKLGEKCLVGAMVRKAVHVENGIPLHIYKKT